MTHSTARRAVHLAAALAVAACATTPRVDVASEERAVRDVNRRLLQAVTAKDADAAANFYAENALWMAPNEPQVTGRTAIRGEWAELFGMPNSSLTWQPTRIEVAASGDLASDVGTYRLSFDSPQGRVEDRGKYTSVWRKIGGEWKMISDTYNTDVPLPQPQTTVLIVEPAGDMMMANAAGGMSFGPIEAPGFKSGMQIAVIHGDPGGKGDYTIRLKFPDGYEFPAHWHPNAEHVTVLSGALRLGMGQRIDPSAIRDYRPGDFLYIPGKMAHFGGTRGETVIQLHGIGPFEIKVVGMS